MTDEQASVVPAEDDATKTAKSKHGRVVDRLLFLIVRRLDV